MSQSDKSYSLENSDTFIWFCTFPKYTTKVAQCQLSENFQRITELEKSK